MTRYPVRRSLFVVVVTAVALLLGPLATPAVADPEDDLHKLEGKLEKAAEEYSDAKEDLDKAEKKQKKLKEDVGDAEDRISQLTDHINEFAEAAYLSGGTPSAAAVLSSGSPDEAVDRMATVGYLGEQSSKELDIFRKAASDLESRKDAYADEVDSAEKAADKKRDAEKKAKDQVEEASGPSSGADAKPFNGGDGGCSETDPTGTGGCVTPRMLHTYNEAQDAQFTRYTSCFRGGGGGEHPKGRACDFSSAKGGFEGDAQGDDKAYGDELAGWFINNADALGVYYVIWYNQIWMPSTGWADYSSGHTGDPSADHTNHVHVSMN